MTRSEKIAHNRAAKRIEVVYSRTCSGVQIPIMQIGEIFKVGHAAIATGADDAALEAAIVSFVQTIRSN